MPQGYSDNELVDILVCVLCVCVNCGRRSFSTVFGKQLFSI